MTSSLLLHDPYAPTADLSPCGRYRYTLTRTWDLTLPRVCWVMLNPSTADATRDDPTIRRVLGFSRAWGFGSLVVVNLFAFRTPSPEALALALRSGTDVWGPWNLLRVEESVCTSPMVVAAWGSNPLAKVHQTAMVIRGLAERGEFELRAARITTRGLPNTRCTCPVT